MNENKIKNAVEKIEPENGAKERMYENILKKAQSEPKLAEVKSGSKKAAQKIVRFALPIAACFCVVLFGLARFLPADVPPATEPTTEDEFVLAGNPFAEASSAEDFKKLGITLDAPGGSENVRYSIIDEKIANINFTFEEHEFCLSAAEREDDFSGLFGEERSKKTLENGAVLTILSDEAGTYSKVSFKKEKIAYYLCNVDGAESELVEKLALEVF